MTFRYYSDGTYNVYQFNSYIMSTVCAIISTAVVLKVWYQVPLVVSERIMN